MYVEKRIIEPTYKKDNGTWALDTQKVLLGSMFVPIEQSIIHLPAGQAAGNHRHARQEALLGIGATAFFLWQDENGKVYEEAMNPNNTLYLFVIPPNVPHAVINRSSDEPVILYEYFDDIHSGVEKVNLLRELERS